MKSLIQIQKLKDKINVHEYKYPGMTYEQGVENALAWVLDEMDEEENNEFEEQL